MSLLDAAGNPVVTPDAVIPDSVASRLPVIDRFTAEVLPDSRTKEAKDLVWGMFGAMQWIYCVYCGTKGGLVPVENITTVSWICNACFPIHGQDTLLMVTSDEVFYEKVKQEQLEKFGRFLTEPELVSVVEADASPLATLILTQGR